MNQELQNPRILPVEDGGSPFGTAGGQAEELANNLQNHVHDWKDPLVHI